MGRKSTVCARRAATEKVHVQAAEVEAGAHVEQRALQIERLWMARVLLGISRHTRGREEVRLGRSLFAAADIKRGVQMMETAACLL